MRATTEEKKNVVCEMGHIWKNKIQLFKMLTGKTVENFVKINLFF